MHLRIAGTAGLAALAAAALVAVAACSAPATDPASGSDSAAGVVRPAAFTTDTPSTTDPAASAGHTISVTATGTATGAPDTLTVQLGVQTQARTAGDALKENNTKATALIASLTGQGIAKKDLATSDLSIYPTYGSNGTTITGYQVSNTVTATLHDVAKAGSVIDAAAKAAGDAIRLNQVGFSYDDDSALRANARADAVKQAMTQAKQLADAAGVALGPIVSISEGDTSDQQPQPVFARAAADTSGASMPVLSGEGQLTVTVKVIVSIG